MKRITEDVVEPFRARLEQHPVYAAVETIADLRCFMEHHIYSVWDFMSLIKYLQQQIAPTTYPWLPVGDGAVRRFINELVLEEESDQSMEEGQFSSHFELYQHAMGEVGASVETIRSFSGYLSGGMPIQQAMEAARVPKPSARFTGMTFDFIESGKPHQVAAALALGREHIIPGMFRAILKQIGITDQQAPIFHFYLRRHIHLDEDFHAPLSLQLLNELCAGDAVKIEESLVAAEQAVEARLQFWDGVQQAILSQKEDRQAV